MSNEDLKAELEQLQENAALRKEFASGIRLKVSEKAPAHRSSTSQGRPSGAGNGLFAQVAVQQATITRQNLVDALIENIEKSLSRRPVKQGLSGDEHYLYRGEVANTAIKMAGLEVGLFKDKAEVTHRMDFSDLSDEELLLRLRDETEALLLERRAAGLDNGSDEG